MEKGASQVCDETTTGIDLASQSGDVWLGIHGDISGMKRAKRNENKRKRNRTKAKEETGSTKSFSPGLVTARAEEDLSQAQLRLRWNDVPSIFVL